MDKLLTYEKNRYIFTRSTMEAVEKIGNMNKFPEDDTNWKVVPHILRLMLNDDVKFEYTEDGGKD
ncbi:MAG: hypothetical protein A2W19_16150 [Spirochaetes bacterium RBG_16_49_21]|nr:MAG: hypothetical protein A2W19_16150 [Spirochaetes bacterium RBG_16_49_21]